MSPTSGHSLPGRGADGVSTTQSRYPASHRFKNLFIKNECDFIQNHHITLILKSILQKHKQFLIIRIPFWLILYIGALIRVCINADIVDIFFLILSMQRRRNINGNLTLTLPMIFLNNFIDIKLHEISPCGTSEKILRG